MLIISLVVLGIYAGVIITNVLRTNLKRKRIKVGDFCMVYLGENKIEAFVLGVEKEIEVKVFSRVFLCSREAIYA